MTSSLTGQSECFRFLRPDGVFGHGRDHLRRIRDVNVGPLAGAGGAKVVVELSSLELCKGSFKIAADGKPVGVVYGAAQLHSAKAVDGDVLFLQRARRVLA